MTPEQKSRADAILADAADAMVPRQKVLNRMSELAQRELGGDDRHRLVDQVYALLDQRDHNPGNDLYVTHSTFKQT